MLVLYLQSFRDQNQNCLYQMERIKYSNIIRYFLFISLISSNKMCLISMSGVILSDLFLLSCVWYQIYLSGPSLIVAGFKSIISGIWCICVWQQFVHYKSSPDTNFYQYYYIYIQREILMYTYNIYTYIHSTLLYTCTINMGRYPWKRLDSSAGLNFID